MSKRLIEYCRKPPQFAIINSYKLKLVSTLTFCIGNRPEKDTWTESVSSFGIITLHQSHPYLFVTIQSQRRRFIAPSPFLAQLHIAGSFFNLSAKWQKRQTACTSMQIIARVGGMCALFGKALLYKARGASHCLSIWTNDVFCAPYALVLETAEAGVARGMYDRYLMLLDRFNLYPSIWSWCNGTCAGLIKIEHPAKVKKTKIGAHAAWSVRKCYIAIQHKLWKVVLSIYTQSI